MTRAAYYYYLWLFFAAGMTAVFPFTITRSKCEARQSQAAVTANTKPVGKIYRTTGYCPGPCCCGDSADGITASGYRIRKGDHVCAAPATLRFGTLLDIPGYGKSVPVVDRGGAIVEKGTIRTVKGKTSVVEHDRLDLYFPTHKEALAWGVQYLTVTYSQEN